MLDQFALLASIVALFYLVYWSIRNEGVSSIDRQKGLLRMPPPNEGQETTPRAARTSAGSAHSRPRRHRR